MRSASKKRGIEVTSISRPIKPSDFRDFDLILAMDRQNYGSLSGPVIHDSLSLDFLCVLLDVFLLNNTQKIY
jgi:protein-tyrosine phosphatase